MCLESCLHTTFRHAEPEQVLTSKSCTSFLSRSTERSPQQAAQMLSGYQSRNPAAPTRLSPSSQASPYQQPPTSYQNKPPPRKPPQPAPSPTYARPYHDAYPPPVNHTGRRPSPSSSYNNNNTTFNYGNSPPPTNYGFGPRPTDPHNRPPPSSRPPPTPAPGPSGGRGGMDEDASLFALFQAVDKEGRGQLTERELGSALVNGDFTSFDPYTVRMMIRMFDTDRSGTIAFAEFRYVRTHASPLLVLSFHPPSPSSKANKTKPTQPKQNRPAQRKRTLTVPPPQQQPLGLPRLVAHPLRPLRRRRQRHHQPFRVQPRPRRLRLHPVRPLRRPALPHLRQARRGRHGLRPLRPVLHLPQAHDRCL